MIGLFKRRGRSGVDGADAMGASTVAVRLEAGSVVAPSCIGVVCDKGGGTRRLAPGAKLDLHHAETAWCFHPGPYGIDLLPFAAAPEIGLRVGFAVDGPDPRVAQQRFDLYLVSEAGARLDLCTLGAAIETALQRELAQGNLDLPPCTTLDEWNAFRAGFNELLYTRFGVTVDDCVPVDLGDVRDYAQMLLARAAAAATAPEPEHVCAGAAIDTPAAPAMLGAMQADDARALRRLFLELPCVMCALRLTVLPPGPALFRQHQALLHRLDQVSLSVGTMPALELSAPGQALAADAQTARARHSVLAVAALDEAWALLARLKLAAGAQLPALFDEADRIIANLEHGSAARRIATPESAPQ